MCVNGIAVNAGKKTKILMTEVGAEHKDKGKLSVFEFRSARREQRIGSSR